MIHSHFTYLVELWGSADWCNLSSLQVIQSSALRNLYNLPYRTNRMLLYSTIPKRILPLRGIYQYGTVVFKSLRGLHDSNLVLAPISHPYSLRTGSNILLRLRANTRFGMARVTRIGAQLLNSLPLEVRSCVSFLQFSKRLNLFLLHRKYLSGRISGSADLKKS